MFDLPSRETWDGTENAEMMTDSSKTAENIIGKAIEVHRELGSGLLESGDEACFAYELVEPGLSFFPT